MTRILRSSVFGRQRFCFLVFALFCSLCLCASAPLLHPTPVQAAASATTTSLTQETFANLKNAPGPRLVLFYYSSDAKAQKLLDSLAKTAKRLRKDPLVPNDFQVVVCDGDATANSAEFASAQFSKDLTYLFTTTPVEGIVKYTRARTAKAMSEHVRSKFLQFDAKDVQPFTNVLQFYNDIDTTGRAVFVKFFETWCEHCKRLAQTFQQSATHFAGAGAQHAHQIRFVEVHCSKNNETTDFCTREQVKSYPVLRLFTSEAKHSFEEEMRSVAAFDDFFAKHVPQWRDGDKATTKDSKKTLSPPAIIEKDGDAVEDVPEPKIAATTIAAKVEKVVAPAVEAVKSTIAKATSVASKAVPIVKDGDAVPDIAAPASALNSASAPVADLSRLESRLTTLETSIEKLTALLERQSIAHSHSEL